MDWEIKVVAKEDDPGQWTEVQHPTITLTKDGSECYRVLLPEAFTKQFYKKAPDSLVVVGRKLNKYKGNEVFTGPFNLDKTKQELQDAIDWLMEYELDQLGSGSTAENQTNGEGEESMSTKKEVKNPEITWEGRNITLPALPKHMAPRDAAKVLLDKAKEEEQAISIMEEIADCFPWDGAVQFSRAMGQLHGWGRAISKQSFFGERPPTAIAVQTGPDTHEEVIWGEFKIPGMDEGTLDCGYSEKGGRLVFCIRGTVKKKDLPLVRAVADLTRKLARTSSIYRGKAIQLVLNEDGKINWEEQPRFLAPPVTMDDLVYPNGTLAQIKAHLLAPIVKSTRARLAKFGKPFGGAYVINGKYGVGKTALAAAMANICTDNDVTYIEVTKLTALEDALVMARMYGPCLLFVEDVDRLSESGEDYGHVIANTLDGVSSKGAEVMVIFTTNHVGVIPDKLTRRFRFLLTINPPDAEATEKLIRLRGRSLIDSEEDLSEAAAVLAGQIPSMIADVVEGAKDYAIAFSDSDNDADLRITGKDILYSAQAKAEQIELLNREKVKVLSNEEEFGQAMTKLIVANAPAFPERALKALDALAKKLGL